MFMFLAGWSYSYSKSNKSYIQGLVITQIKYMIFMTLVYIVICISNKIGFSNNPVGISNLVNWFLHTYSKTNPLPSVSYSLWFFRMYFFVTIIGSMIITIIKPKMGKYLIGTCFIAIFMITFFAPKIGIINLGIQLSQLLFYLFFFSLGYYMKDKNISLGKFVLSITLIILALIGIKYFSNINIIDIQNNKFPPNFVFMLWSLFGVVIAIFLKNFFINCKENILSKIGQNSMYIFFAQCVGASILYYVSKYITMDWYYKIWIMFGINILITSVVTIILKLVLDPVGKYCRKVLKEKICN